MMPQPTGLTSSIRNRARRVCSITVLPIRRSDLRRWRRVLPSNVRGFGRSSSRPAVCSSRSMAVGDSGAPPRPAAGASTGRHSSTPAGRSVGGRCGLRSRACRRPRGAKQLCSRWALPSHRPSCESAPRRPPARPAPPTREWRAGRRRASQPGATGGQPSAGRGGPNRAQTRSEMNTSSAVTIKGRSGWVPDWRYSSRMRIQGATLSPAYRGAASSGQPR